MEETVYTRQKIDVDIEKQIITGLIVDDQYCSGAVKMIHLEHLSSKYFRRIASWSIDYYKKYKKAPKENIQKIFAAEGSKLKEDEKDLISTLLENISDEYAEREEQHGKFNSDLLLEYTREFCDKRNLEKLCDQVEGHLLKGQTDKAANVVRAFAEVRKETSKWVNPFDPEVVKRILREDDSDELFKLSGPLGEISGMLKRGWLIAFLGGTKRGKSWYLLELAYQALMAGMKVVYVSLEMSEKEVIRRLYAKLSAGMKTKSEVVYPIFDCAHNQTGECKRDERRNEEILDCERDSGIPRYTKDRNKKYQVCNYCRKYHLPDYEPSVWYKVHDGESLTPKLVLAKAALFKKMFRDNLRVIAYPLKSVGWNQILADIDDLEYTDGFVGDVGCFDYFDIMLNDSEDHFFSERGQINAIWGKGKRLAGEKHMLVATVDQANRGGLAKEDLDEEDNSEDIRKLQHVDLQFAINQIPDEKYAGIIRMNVLEHRHQDFNKLSQVMILQSLKLGQTILDQEYAPKTYHRKYGSMKKKDGQGGAKSQKRGK